MAFRDLREFVEKIETSGGLLRVKKEIDPNQEISAAIIKAGPAAVLCEKVKGYDIPVVANLFGDREKINMALGLEKENPIEEYLKRVERLQPPIEVGYGPVKEHVVTGEKVDLPGMLPILVVNEKDGGRYISSGIIVAKDPEFGYNLALHRLQIKGKHRAGIYMSELQHLHLYFKRAEERNEPLEIAVIIGCDPSLYLASVVTGPPDLDEYAVAGALRKEPLEMVKCETVDLLVPAHAEIVLEGRMLPHTREKEGPFGEFSKYYGPEGERPVIEFTALSHRSRPMYQALYLGRRQRENVYLTSLPKAADLYRAVKEVAPEVKDIYLTPGGCGRYHAVVSLKKRFEGEPRLILSVVLSHRIGVKHAIVVDEDVDIYDPHEVEWAMATRFQFDRDSFFLNDTPIHLDPSSAFKRKTGLLTSKLGMDATLPLGVPYPQVCDVSKEVMKKIEDNWQAYLEG
ncbi:MAG: UbiD family decarboxylase [Deltaproteobacteria bacterium]|nr:UbiD family decarboxylase [Deltaproteobacteria bacterium]